MKLTSKFFVAVSAFTLLLASCGKKDTGAGGGTTTPTVDKPVVTVSKSTMVADGFDETVITVKDKNGNDITAQCFVTANGTQLNTSGYSTTTTGNINFKAKLGAVESAVVAVNATAPVARNSHKVVIEQYTGTWCGWCPRVAKAIKDAQVSSPNVIGVSVHNGDALAYSLESQMRAKWGVTGFPTAVINRGNKWTDNSSSSLPQSEVTNPMQTWAPLGMAIESNVAGSVISGTVRTKFNMTTTIPLVITILLIENGVVLSQRNFYSNNASQSGSPFFSLPDPITNYVHNNVLRQSSTNVFGDAIPTTAPVFDAEYSKTFSFTAGPSYNLNNCEIVSFVSYADGVTGRKGVLNAQIVKAGSNKSFD
jgi:hypothetical protein